MKKKTEDRITLQWTKFFKSKEYVKFVQPISHILKELIKTDKFNKKTDDYNDVFIKELIGFPMTVKKYNFIKKMYNILGM